MKINSCPAATRCPVIGPMISLGAVAYWSSTYGYYWWAIIAAVVIGMIFWRVMISQRGQARLPP